MAPQRSRDSEMRRQRRRNGVGRSPLAWGAVLVLLLREAACFSAPRPRHRQNRQPTAASVGTPPPLRTRRRPVPGIRRLGGASSDEDFLDGLDDSGDDPKAEERSPGFRDDEEDTAVETPGRLSLGYRIASAANALAGLSLLWSLGSIGRSSLSVPLSVPLGAASHRAASVSAASYRPGLLPTYASGALFFLVVSGVCSVLSGAAEKGRMRSASGTYRSMTFGSMLCGSVGLLSLPGEAGCLLDGTTRVRFVIALVATVLARLVTATVSFAGWEHSSGTGKGFGTGFRERVAGVAKEVLKGFGRIRKTLPISEERPASAYRSFFIFSVIGNLAFNVPELVFNLQNGGGRLFSLSASLTVASVARLCLVSALLLVLKDAAERRRLEGSTFIKLNLLIGLWSLGGEWQCREAVTSFLYPTLYPNSYHVLHFCGLRSFHSRHLAGARRRHGRDVQRPEGGGQAPVRHRVPEQRLAVAAVEGGRH